MLSVSGKYTIPVPCHGIGKFCLIWICLIFKGFNVQVNIPFVPCIRYGYITHCLGDETWLIVSSWWNFNMWLQPIWKICKSQIGFPETPSFGMNISKNIWNQPRPSKKVQVFSQPTGFAGSLNFVNSNDMKDDMLVKIPWRSMGLKYLATWMVDFYGECMVNIPVPWILCACFLQGFFWGDFLLLRQLLGWLWWFLL